MAVEAQGFNYTVSVILGLQEAQDVYERNGTILTYRGVPLGWGSSWAFARK